MDLALPLPATRRHPPRPAPLDIATLVPAPAWATLPPSLRRRFAPGHAPARYAGTLSLRRSRVGALFAWATRPFGAPLPRANATVPTTVDVRPTPGGGVTWSRHLGPAVIRSTKSPGPGRTLLEQTDGGLGMVLDVTVEDAALVFTSRTFFLSLGPWRFPVPPLLTPGTCRVEHRAVDDAHFRFTLSMTHPLWGTTFHQAGVFTEATP